jgi:hypothetical protein
MATVTLETVTLEAVRAHPEYRAMLANLTEVQARCTEQLEELRQRSTLLAQRADELDVMRSAILRWYRYGSEDELRSLAERRLIQLKADSAAPSALPTDRQVREHFAEWLESLDRPITGAERRTLLDQLRTKPSAVPAPGPVGAAPEPAKPTAMFAGGTVRCGECAMAAPLHKVSCSKCPGNEENALPPAPVPMLLTCPGCGKRHIDRGRFETYPHHTHACQHCGMCWRPAVEPTVGVRYLPGFKDAKPAKGTP